MTIIIVINLLNHTKEFEKYALHFKELVQLPTSLDEQHLHSKQQLLQLALALALAFTIGALLGEPFVEHGDLKVQNVQQTIFLLDDVVLVFGELVGDIEGVLQLDTFFADPRQQVVELPEIAYVGGLLEQQSGRALFDRWLEEKIPFCELVLRMGATCGGCHWFETSN